MMLYAAIKPAPVTPMPVAPTPLCPGAPSACWSLLFRAVIFIFQRYRQIDIAVAASHSKRSSRIRAHCVVQLQSALRIVEADAIDGGDNILRLETHLREALLIAPRPYPITDQL